MNYSENEKKLFYITLIIAILCVISIFICDWTIKKNAASCIYTEISDIPANNVGLLLGTSPKLKAEITIYILTIALMRPVELYKAGKINYILISGDNRKEDYNEPEEMKKRLCKKVFLKSLSI